MIPAAPHDGFLAVFGAYVHWLVRRSFHNVWVAGDMPAGGFIVAANHTSWWDGFVPFLAQRSIDRRRRFSIMMDEGQLRRFPFFRLGGAFSVDGTIPRRAVASIRYAATLAAEGSGVWIFPEGRIPRPNERAAFTSGFVHAARYAQVSVLPVAMRFAMLQTQRPHAFLSFGAPIDPFAAGAVQRTRECVRTLLADIDFAVSARYFERTMRPLLVPAAGIDDLVAKVCR